MALKLERPRTLKGLKRRATEIKRRDGIPHHRALEAAAVEAGFPSYSKALNALSPPSTRKEL